jgi:hypothetical protein
LATFERAADITVARSIAARAVGIGETQMADREVQPIQPAEHSREGPSGAFVDDQLAGARPPTEASVGNREQPQIRERHRAALMPKSARLELRLHRPGQRLDRRLIWSEREQHRR